MIALDGNDGEVRALLIPTGAFPIVLPNASVSEVIDFREPARPAAGMPDWLLGSVTWRQQAMPVASIERMFGQPFNSEAPKLRIVVCYGIRQNGRFPYLGFVAKGIPRMMRVTEAIISASEETEIDPDWPLLARVKLQGQDALIPDLDRLDALLVELD